MSRGDRALAAIVLAACGGPDRAPAAIDNAGGTTEVRDCWLGEAVCELAVDMDNDGTPDRVELVRDEPCGSSDDDHPCRQGLRITLSSGPVWVVGAGHPLEAFDRPTPYDPIPLEADLGFVVAIEDGLPPQSGCIGPGVIISGGDGAALVCLVGGEPRAFHLGF